MKASIKMKRYDKIDHIIDSLINGQFSQAKEQAQHGCKTLPEKQARRVGQVVGALCDPIGFQYRPDLAVAFLNLFDN